MKSICVVFHSRGGHTRAQALAVAEGAESAGIQAVHLVDVTGPTEFWGLLESADAMVFGAPTYMGSLSGPFKTFMDQTGGIYVAQRWRNKLAAGFTSSSAPSGDKLLSLMQLMIFAAQHGMHWISLGVLPGSAEQRDDAENLNRLGSWMGAMAQCSSHHTSTLCASDYATARALGARVASILVDGHFAR